MQRLLIIKTSSLGDIVHGLQVVQTIRQQQPWHISWVVREPFAAMVERAECVDDILLWRPHQGLRAVIDIIQQLRTRHYDRVLDMQGLLVSGLMSGSAQAPEKWGRSDSREGSRFFYNRRVPLPPGPPPHHALDILLEFCRASDLETTLNRPLQLKPVAPPGWSDFFADAKSPVVAIFPDSSIKRKQWWGFEPLTQQLFQSFPELKIVWCARHPIQPEQVFPDQRFLNLTGCPLDEMITLLTYDVIVINNDSGPMHLAAALGKKIIGIFGPTSPQRFGPYPLADRFHTVVQAPAGDLQKLTVERVLEKLKTVLKSAFDQGGSSGSGMGVS